MTLTDDFKEKLKVGQHSDAFILAMSKDIEVQMSTCWVNSSHSSAKQDSCQAIALTLSQLFLLSSSTNYIDNSHIYTLKMDI